MRIVMVSNNYTPYSGGVVSSINVSVEQLQRMGHEVSLISFDFTARHTDDPDWVHRMWSPIRFMYKSNHMAIAWRPYTQIKRLFAQFKPDIIHVHHPFLLGSVAATLAHEQRIPVVFTYHTIYEDFAHYVPLPELFVRWGTTHIVRTFCKRVHGIIAPSNGIAQLIQQQSPRIAVIATGLQHDFLPNTQEIEPHNERLRLLVVSRLVKGKNVHVALDVAHQLNLSGIDYQLQIIGYGQDYEQLVQYAFEKLCLSPKQVSFVHRPPRSVITQAYKDADILLFTSRSETQGLVLAEAMAGATTVIAFDGDGQRDIVKQGHNGYIVADQTSMVAMIQHLNLHRDQLVSLKRAAHLTAYAYHPEQTVQRLVDFYQLVMQAAH